MQQQVPAAARHAACLIAQLHHLHALGGGGAAAAAASQQQHQQYHQHHHQPHTSRRLATTAAPQQQQQPASSNKPTLKAALRQLFLRVHPDRFTDYPAEQAENERSFKLLQEYLQQARAPTLGPASRAAYHFRFFLMPQQQPQHADAGARSSSGSDEDDGDEAEGGGSSGGGGSGSISAPQFDLVQLVLVPPPPPPPSHAQSSTDSSDGSSNSSSHSVPLSAGARQGLLKLLRMCGLGDVEAEAEAEGVDAAARLTTFLPQAAEVVRQHESGPARHETRIANLRAAFRLAHRVVAGFQPGAFTSERQIELLQRLARAFDLLADDHTDSGGIDLSGLHILIGARTALGSQGVLCLDADGSEDEWAAFLGGVDADYARHKQAAAAAVRALEGRVAAALGVRMLFTAAPYLMTHEWRGFLERMAAHAAEAGPVQVPGSSSSSSTTTPDKSSSTTPDSSSSQQQLGLSAVPVYVSPAAQPADGAGASSVHEEVGFIQVPMAASGTEAAALIAAHAPAALAVLAGRAAQQAELEALTASVRSRLNLRRLHRDALVTVEQFRAACKRLLQHRDVLMRCGVEGLSLRVSDANRVAPDGSVVDVCWDFEM